ncbi:ECF RNA polymerase sigma factor SigW [compost metagenome]
MSGYRKYDDKELILFLKEGDQAAFTEIYNRYWASMYSHVYKMLRSQEESKDLLQDMFSSLWLKAADIDEQTKLSGYLYLSARNRVFNLIQRNKVKNDYLASVAQFISEAGTETMERLDEKDLINAIESEIQNLPPKMREIFELSRKANLTHKEIAEKLNISDQTVRKQVQNALRILKPKVQAIQVGVAFLLFLR